MSSSIVVEVVAGIGVVGVEELAGSEQVAGVAEERGTTMRKAATTSHVLCLHLRVSQKLVRHLQPQAQQHLV